MFLQHFEHIHVDQSGEDDGLVALVFCCLVDLSDSLMGFVNGVGEGQSNVPGFHVELRQDGIAKSLGGDARAVRNKKNAAFGHGCKKFKWGRQQAT